MAVKSYSTFPRSSEVEPHQFSVILRALKFLGVGKDVLLLCRGSSQHIQNLANRVFIWYLVFLSKTNNLQPVVWIQVFLSNTNNLYTITWFRVTISIYQLLRRCPWCSRYRRRKWTRRYEFKSWTRLIAFHIALIPLGKVWIQLFSLQLWVNSRTD